MGFTLLNKDFQITLPFKQNHPVMLILNLHLSSSLQLIIRKKAARSFAQQKSNAVTHQEAATIIVVLIPLNLTNLIID